jgi:hypothetical protein
MDTLLGKISAKQSSGCHVDIPISLFPSKKLTLHHVLGNIAKNRHPHKQSHPPTHIIQRKLNEKEEKAQ